MARVGRSYPVPQHLRHNLPAVQGRQYAAAKSYGSAADWSPVNKSINDLIRSSAVPVRAKVRQLVRDFPYFTRAQNNLVDFIVGTGMTFQSRVRNPDYDPAKKSQNKFDKKSQQKIEDAVSWAYDELDITGRQHGRELERLSKRQDVECGEFLFIKKWDRTPGRYLPYALQAVEADWLTDFGAKVAAGNKLDQGIEYNLVTGKTVAYHFTDPDGWGRTLRVLAADVIHGFDTKRPGQLRGISDLVSGVLVAHDLSDYMDSTFDTAKMASKYLALVTTADPAGRQLGAGMQTDAETGKKLDHLENAIVEYLRPGETMQFANASTVSDAFDPVTKLILRMFCVSSGVPYSLISGDYSGLNYTVLRGERNDFAKILRAPIARHIRQLPMVITRDVIDLAVLHGKLDLPGYYNNPHHYRRAVWIPDGMEPIDPLKESKANRDDIASGLRSPQEIVAKRGRDIEDVLNEIEDFKQMCADRGLTFEQGSTALANNPAALDAADDRSINAALIEILDQVQGLKEE